MPNSYKKPKGYKKKTAKELKQDLINTFYAIGGYNRLISMLNKCIDQNDIDTVLEFLKMISKFVPKEVDQTINHKAQGQILHYHSNVPDAIEDKTNKDQPIDITNTEYSIEGEGNGSC